jgi:plasmid replication initiation protein
MSKSDRIKFEELEKLGEDKPRKYSEEEAVAILKDPQELTKAMKENRMEFLLELFEIFKKSKSA